MRSHRPQDHVGFLGKRTYEEEYHNNSFKLISSSQFKQHHHNNLEEFRQNHPGVGLADVDDQLAQFARHPHHEDSHLKVKGPPGGANKYWTTDELRQSNQGHWDYAPIFGSGLYSQTDEMKYPLNGKPGKSAYASSERQPTTRENSAKVEIALNNHTLVKMGAPLLYE
jgi:hypothetical protein